MFARQHDLGETNASTDLEMKADQREDQALQVLHEVVEDAQALGIRAVLHVQQRADFRALHDKNPRHRATDNRMSVRPSQ